MNKTVSSIAINAWWDKSTGLMVKWAYHNLPPDGWWANYTLISTSLWGTGATGTGGGIPTTYLIIGGGAILVLAIVVVLLRRHK